VNPSQYAKALVGALVAGLSALLPVMEDGLTATECVVAVIAALIALGAIFQTPNQAPAGQPADPDLSEQSGLDDGGHTDALFLIGITVAVACGVLLATLVLRALG